MKIETIIDDTAYSTDLNTGQSIAITLVPNEQQPNHFSAPDCTSKTLIDGDFIGDTKQGGSCNVNQLTLVPHCNGTHTESISHIVNESVAVFEAIDESFFSSTLISLTPVDALSTDEKYIAGFEAGQRVITKELLKQKLEVLNPEHLQGLVIRTYPNQVSKKHTKYDQDNYPAYFTEDAMNYIVSKNVQHLLVDLPSVDKMYDQGRLTNHRIFWNVKTDKNKINDKSWINKTITEMIYVEDNIQDGFYLCNLQTPKIATDAVPSHPELYQLTKLK